MENIDLSTTGYCPYCYPEKVDHKQTKLNSFLVAYINKPLSILFQYLFCNRPIYFSDRFLIGLIILLRRWGKVQLQRTLN